MARRRTVLRKQDVIPGTIYECSRDAGPNRGRQVEILDVSGETVTVKWVDTGKTWQWTHSPSDDWGQNKYTSNRMIRRGYENPVPCASCRKPAADDDYLCESCRAG